MATFLVVLQELMNTFKNIGMQSYSRIMKEKIRNLVGSYSLFNSLSCLWNFSLLNITITRKSVGQNLIFKISVRAKIKDGELCDKIGYVNV